MGVLSTLGDGSCHCRRRVQPAHPEPFNPLILNWLQDVIPSVAEESDGCIAQILVYGVIPSVAEESESLEMESGRAFQIPRLRSE